MGFAFTLIFDPPMPDQPSPYALNTAKLNWLDNGTPEATDFDDIYFSRQHGLEETRYVFLEQNQLSTRWQALDKGQPGVFTIAETGFGTGLNFLAACQLWQQLAPSHWRLHFISVEKHPIRLDDLRRALSSWPELKPQADALLAQYPSLIPGHHCLSFGQITLQLFLGDAAEGFNQFLDTDHPSFAANHGPKVDAWFLDGFAPAKNPSMWCDDLFRLIGQLSKTKTSCSTFTAAGNVRRGLVAAGFTMRKAAGYSSKREMLCGTFDKLPGTDKPFKKKGIKALWYLPPTFKPQAKQQKNVAIIGAGLAGATAAYAMAERGWNVTVIERHKKVASEASGNPQGILFTKLSHQTGMLNLFTLHSYLFAARFYQQLAQQGYLKSGDYDFCGMLQLAYTDKWKTQLSHLQQAFSEHQDLAQFHDTQSTSKLAGINLQHPAVFFPKGGWIKPARLCERLLEHPLITLKLENEALSLEQNNQQWQITDRQSQAIIQTDSVIIANSHDAKQFVQTGALPLKSIRGQVTTIPEQGQILKTVLCHEGYISPANNGRFCLGATFDNHDQETAVRITDHQRNLQSLQQAAPSFFPQGITHFNESELGGRVSFRCTSPDYLPLVGAVPKLDQFDHDYAPLRKNAFSDIPVAGSYYPGLYINAGFGSRGLSSAPLCSELLAALINNEPRPVSRDMLMAIAPGRFKIRSLTRNQP